MRPTVVRTAIFLATVVATWGVMSVGGGTGDLNLEVGNLAPREFRAIREAEVPNLDETDRLIQEARAGVDDDDARQTQPEIERVVQDNINEVFDELQMMVISPEAPDPESLEGPELPTTTTTTTDPEDSTTTTLAEPTELVEVSGTVFYDFDADGEFSAEPPEGARADAGIPGMRVRVQTLGGDTFTVPTNGEGGWVVQVEPGTVRVSVDPDDIAIPDGFVPAGPVAQLVECAGVDECRAEPFVFVPNLRSVEELTEALVAEFPIPRDTAAFLAATAAGDVVRTALGGPDHLGDIRAAALDRVDREFGRRVTPEELENVQQEQRRSPPPVVHSDTGVDSEAAAAAGEVVAAFLQANYVIDERLLEDLRTEAEQRVDPVTVQFDPGQQIVGEGERLTDFHIDAINRTTPTLASLEQASVGLLLMVGILVALLGLYLSTFRPEFWARPRMVALLGILVVVAAGAVRAAELAHEATSWYVLPAVAFGFVTAVLFDQRIAILVALSVGVLTAAGTLDLGITVYGTMAALAPIPFVSAVSSRGSFRNAVVLSSLAAAVIASSTAWFFQAGPNDVVYSLFDRVEIPYQVIGEAVAWAFAVSVVASLVGLAALQFFESAFDITTTLGLLDLTDRNHDALQLLQEKAFGTFNHSLMVGTLADAAARAIGANPLLARAMAYYHDLGKTENPSYFIENQFGISNPHDELEPAESAEIIRSHVTEGVALARRFKIPTEVTQGIVSHHGDGVMRYFYEKARELHGDSVEIDDFRHVGHKPRTAETAILMLSDALEAACRAVFQHEEPTPEAIEKVVDRVMDEKIDDGQLTEAPITLAELTKIRKAFLESLVGHYHQRISYPNFPGS